MEVAGRRQTRSKSFLSRKSTKKEQEAHAQQKSTCTARSASLDTHEKEDVARPLFNPYAASIIPDPLNELPSWYHREVEAATASAAQFRVKYPLHNPTGPRWYRNHHLLPPTHDGRPPSVFSPAFPPMSSAPERGQDPSRMAGPSRTPSGSPLPTPSSSQIRIHEPPKPRNRKISQNTQDNVDILNGADAWNPYDQKIDPDSPISPISPGPTSPIHYNHRPRRASLTHGARHRTMAPSPLSQSTSAVHLPAIDPAQIQLPRKLSKRRKPFTGLFNGQDDESVQTQTLRRQSTLAPSMTSLPASMQKTKRGSVLGRLVKRFSVMRKTDKSAVQNGLGTDWNHSSAHPNPPTHILLRVEITRTPKRVPPPSIEAAQRELMVANPDSPSSGDNTPMEATVPLPTVHPEVEMPPAPSKDGSLSPMPRTDSPIQLDYDSTPRPPSLRLEPAASPPPPTSSPPLPDLPPPTPSPALRALSELTETELASSSPTMLPPTPTHARDGASSSASASPASTITPLSAPEDIALARASMYVNPPTPYSAPSALVIPSVAVETQPSQSSTRRLERSPTKTKDGASRSKSTRQTETFKLVRSPSGTIKQATEVIMGMGEQWEIVGTPADAPTKKSKSKEKEREKSKPSDYDQQMVHREESRRRRDHSSSTEEGESRHKRHPSTGGREKSPSIRSTQTPAVPRRSKRSSDAEDSRAVKAASTSTISPSPYQAREQTRERHLSATATTRRNSELHGAADMSSVRAKDAWEMERLWKARSMAYGPDGMPVVSTPATIGSDSRPSTFISTELQRVSSIPSVTAVAELHKTSPPPPRTLFMTPYQGAPSSQPMSPQQFYRHSGYYPHDPLVHNPLPSPPRLSAYQQSPLPMSLTNPLPEPPRLSGYQPAPLPTTFSNSGDSSPSNWQQNAGMTNSKTH
ncbi:hypothetical protein C8Q80DRAFT_1340553 [Daedaleopsis nitida]|nr:hypothetical protein C8Q80DRAFT_1340553 [Daedaleopsis nitida]